MSYESLKSVLIDTDNNLILVSSACSNTDSWYYRNWEYGNGETMENKMTHLLEDCIYGNFHVESSCSIYSIAKRCIQLDKEVSKGIDFIQNDVSLGTHYTSKVGELIARQAAQRLLKGKSLITKEDILALVETAKETWQKIRESRSNNGKVTITCAISLCDKIPGYDALLSEDGKTYIAKSANYHCPVLDNHDNSALVYEEDAFDDFYIRCTKEQLMEKYPEVKTLVAQA